MKKIIITSLLTIASIIGFSQANTYFHDRIDTTIFGVADTVGHGPNNYVVTNASPDFNVKQYVNGLAINVFVKRGNTGSATLRLITRTGTLSARSIEKAGGAQLQPGDIKDSALVLFTFYNTRFRVDVSPAMSPAWQLLGNSGTVAGTNFQGTVDSVDAVYKTNNIERERITANGGRVGINTSNPTAKLHIVSNDSTSLTYAFKIVNSNGDSIFSVRNDGAILAGLQPTRRMLSFGGNNNGFLMSNNSDLIFLGYGIGTNITTGSDIIASGINVFNNLTSGQTMTAYGRDISNTGVATGSANTYFGHSIMQTATTGFYNCLVGSEIMQSATTTTRCSLFGARAGYNSTGDYNCGFGFQCLFSSTGGYNVALGENSLFTNIGGIGNTAIGSEALYFNSGTHTNIGLGYFAGHYNVNGNRLYINNTDRVNAQGDKNGSIIYGIMDPTVSNQILVVNGALYMKDTNAPNHYFSISVTGGAFVLTDTGSSDAP